MDEEVLAALLANLNFVIADLPDSYLGGAILDGTILIDSNAAGYGWFLDATPGDDSEFSSQITGSERQAIGGSAAYGYVDLLTVLEHEIGHLLGLEDLPSNSDGNVMTGTIGLSTRRLATAHDAAIIEYLYDQWVSDNRRRR